MMARSNLIAAIVLFCFLATVSSFFNQQCTHLSGDCISNKPLSAHVGSDILGRPDDEDSPEFREYLKSLLKMQANRAKTGFSAPSSGSADAYIAKLNRLKIERNMRIRAGLPDVPLDGSYRPEDYTAALVEAKEPLVSDRILSGDNPKVQSKGKTRGLTAEEIAFTKLAEERVQESLEKEKLKQVELPDTYKRVMAQSNSRPVSSAPPDETFDFIDEILNRKAPTNPSRVAAPAVSAVPVSVSTPVSDVAPVTQLPKTDLTFMPPIERKSGFKDAVMARLQQQQEAAPAAPVVVASPLPPAAAAAYTATSAEKKLSKEELEIAGEALQALVKHRGGGPFGVGRLQGEEANELFEKLRNVVSLFEAETLASPRSPPVVATATVPVPVSQAAKVLPPPPVEPPVQVQSTQVAPERVSAALDSSIAVALESSDRLPSMLELSKSTIAAAQVSFMSERAVNLNKFLQNPQSLSFNELGALRETLLDCLSAVHVQLTTTSPSGNVVPASPAVASTERAVVSTPGASTSAAGSGSSEGVSELPLEKELRLALGLLIKHRGGPGFGHGRLQGKELSLMEEKLTSVVKRLQAESV